MIHSFLDIHSDEQLRLREFPVAKKLAFLAHAGVTALPRCAADAIIAHTRDACENHQEFGSILRRIESVRETAARLLAASPGEIALLGPTSLGLSLVAEGFPWQPGDEILCYKDDYPANVYPWMGLARLGVNVRYIQPPEPGRITPELVQRALTPRTRLVALASCHFLSGWRINIDEIGRLAHHHGALFCLDAIQTLGAFRTETTHVDFLSADSHKWLLGPLAAGVFFARREHAALLRPVLVGAWNAHSPAFVAQDTVTFPETGRRYEPGVLNIGPLFGMQASMEMLMNFGLDAISAHLFNLRDYLVSRLAPLGFVLIGPPAGHPDASGIATFSHPSRDLTKDFATLEQDGIVASLRQDRTGRFYLRFSPHCYNTLAEMDRLADSLLATA